MDGRDVSLFHLACCTHFFVHQIFRQIYMLLGDKCVFVAKRDEPLRRNPVYGRGVVRLYNVNDARRDENETRQVADTGATGRGAET